MSKKKIKNCNFFTFMNKLLTVLIIIAICAWGVLCYTNYTIDAYSEIDNASNGEGQSTTKIIKKEVINALVCRRKPTTYGYYNICKI